MDNIWHTLPKPFFILAPMEAVTDVIFRHVVREAAAPDLFFTEFTNATGWVHAGDKAIGGRLVRTEDETSLIAQLWGAVPEDMAKLAAHCQELGYRGIDINMGCPDSSAVKAGGGAGMIRTPDVASAIIEAARSSGLPVSVKTRLGYSYVDEWRDWLTHLLQQDIVNLTIHLRTKKEMSKVPAHFELIPEIIALRDLVAPQTLLTINGDIEDRTQGLELVKQHPGLDGIMIGRGIFHNPFCFKPIAHSPSSSSKTIRAGSQSEHSSSDTRAAYVSEDEMTVSSTAVEPLTSTPARVTDGGAAPAFDKISDFSKEGANHLAGPETSDLRSEAYDGSERRTQLINLLRLQLDLYDQYSAQTGRPFDTLKRFFKIYINSFDGAAELRDKLMHTKNTDEVRALLP